jgi:hypothetical protein
MLKSWRIWDGTSAFANNPYATPEALKKAYNLDSTKKLVVYKDDSGNENMVKVYASPVSKDTIQADFDTLIAQQQAAEKTAKQPTQEQKQLAAMALTQAQQAETITVLQKTNAALMLKLAGGNT